MKFIGYHDALIWFNFKKMPMEKLLLAVCIWGIAICTACAHIKDVDTIKYCKFFVNGERYAFEQTFTMVQSRLDRAKNCFVISLPHKDAEVAVYHQLKGHYLVCINGKGYDYDCDDEGLHEASCEITDEMKKQELERWGKHSGYCTALSRHKENVLIIYER